VGGALALSAPGPLISLGSPAFTEGFLPNLSIHEKTKQTLCGGAFIGWLAWVPSYSTECLLGLWYGQGLLWPSSYLAYYAHILVSCVYWQSYMTLMILQAVLK